MLVFTRDEWATVRKVTGVRGDDFVRRRQRSVGGRAGWSKFARCAQVLGGMGVVALSVGGAGGNAGFVVSVETVVIFAARRCGLLWRVVVVVGAGAVFVVSASSFRRVVVIVVVCIDALLGALVRVLL